MDQENNKGRKKHSFVFFLNIGLTFTLIGIILSFFIFAYEKNDKGNGSFAFAQDRDSKVDKEQSLKAAVEVQNSIRAIVDDNMPGVVNISTEIEQAPRRGTQQDQYYEEFFRHFFGEQAPQQGRSQKSLGSGFIVDEDGYVLSNYHVVKGATKITIILFGDDTEYPAELVGYDEGYDLALLKIQASKKLPYVTIGDSDLVEPGEFAVAIGNPYGLNNTVTFGIVSAKGRSDVGASIYQRYIQTDVAINPGNSGGPLFNIYGEVIGINTLIYSTSGGNIGIGFATPINIAKSVITQLRETGRVTRGYLGLYPQDIDENLARGFNLKNNAGVFISEVIPDSPASRAGLKDGDVIIEIDGQKTDNSSDLYNIVSQVPVGKSIAVKYIRNGREKSTKVTIEARPDNEDESIMADNKQTKNKTSEERWLDITVSGITPDIASRLQIRKNETGVVVINMSQYSKAYQAGLRPGDVIKAINGVGITSVEDYTKFVKANNSKSDFTITIKRARMTYVLIIE